MQKGRWKVDVLGERADSIEHTGFCPVGTSMVVPRTAALAEILEERSIGKSTMFTTQLPFDHWSEVIAAPVIADAIRDRLEHAGLTIHITGESYRGVKARQTCQQEKKDAYESSPSAPPVT